LDGQSRKPDPNYPVVSFRPGKKGGSIEILDYNFAVSFHVPFAMLSACSERILDGLQRVEPAIQDKKGSSLASSVLDSNLRLNLALPIQVSRSLSSSPSASSSILSSAHPLPQLPHSHPLQSRLPLLRLPRHRDQRLQYLLLPRLQRERQRGVGR